jgi:hypothetical protein
MAEGDDIVQKVIIEVDDAALAKVGDTAATSFNKLEQAAGSAGSSLQGMQAAAGQVGTGAAKLGAGLEQATQKTLITTREMRSLGAVMRTVGEGAAASAAVGFVKIGAALGPIGIALFAAAEAFSYIKGKMKEAEDQAKATVEVMAKIAKISAEEAPKGPTPFTGGAAYDLPKAIDSAKAFVAALKDAGIAVDDVTADTKKLGEESYKAGLQAATIYEKLAPIEKANFEKVLKDLGFPPETIASIEKGSAAFKRAHDEAAKPFFTPEQQKSIDELAKGWDAFAEASKKAWAQVAGDAETGTAGWAQTVAAAIATLFADGMAHVGQFERDVVAVLSNLPAEVSAVFNSFVQTIEEAFTSVANTIENAFNAIWGPIQSVLDRIGSAIDYLVGKAQALISALGSLMGFGGGGSVGGGGGSPSGMATGGEVGGAPGVDRNLAYLSAGEFVMRVAAVQKFGLPFMHSINAGLAPRFAMGGLNVGGVIGGSVSAAPRVLNLTIEGQSFAGMSVPENTAAALERFAVHSQIASTGRKQSWRR